MINVKVSFLHFNGIVTIIWTLKPIFPLITKICFDVESIFISHGFIDDNEVCTSKRI